MANTIMNVDQAHDLLSLKRSTLLYVNPVREFKNSSNSPIRRDVSLIPTRARLPFSTYPPLQGT